MISATAGMLPASSYGHVAYSGSLFMHQRHSREFSLWNQIDSAQLRAETRDAQLQLHDIYNGSLRFPTASSSSAAAIVAVDAYYNEPFAGRAYNWDYHYGQGRLQMNTRVSVADWQAQGVACHELSHFTGLAHSSDASDCMRDNLPYMQSSTLSVAHRDQMRSQWNATGH